MNFKPYQHIERFGTDEVEGIQFGRCYVFYKIDGTNASVWLNNNNELCAGSRKRELSLESDNAGFMNHIVANEKIKNYLVAHPNHRLYGEWLVPHSLKTYRDDAWRTFYVFDACLDTEDGGMEYLPYPLYQPLLDEFGIDYIPPLAIVNNPTEETLYHLLDKTGQFLIKDGSGKGEGIVIKNYDYYNKYNRQTWAKIVTTEFKEKHHKVMGAPEIDGKESIEMKIVDRFCTDSFVEKEYQKIANNTGWSSKCIPRLLSTVFHELIVEETWNIVKLYKNPTINYKTLQSLVIQRIKEVKKELFY